MAKLSPIVSEFATTEEAEAYDLWFRAKVQAVPGNPGAGIPRDQVMARIRALIGSKRNASDLGR